MNLIFSILVLIFCFVFLVQLPYSINYYFKYDEYYGILGFLFKIFDLFEDFIFNIKK